MSPARSSTTLSELMASSTSPTIYTIDHTHPTLTSISIIALTLVVIVVGGIGYYSIYSCYRSAMYQQELERTESQRARGDTKIMSQKDQLEHHRTGFGTKEQTGSSVNFSSVFSFQSSSTMPDLTSPPLAVTYSTHAPHHASPIFRLPADVETVTLSSPPTVFLDSNSIPFYVPESPSSPFIDPKLAPVGGAFEYTGRSNSRARASETARAKFSPLISDSSCLPSMSSGTSTTAVCPRPRSFSSSARLSRTRATSIVEENCDPFARVVPVAPLPVWESIVITGGTSAVPSATRDLFPAPIVKTWVTSEDQPNLGGSNGSSMEQLHVTSNRQAIPARSRSRSYIPVASPKGKCKTKCEVTKTATARKRLINPKQPGPLL
ncbi:hypothetical protein BDP27DRAFT_1446542 [Rhodocollybia butyracea]|uniref:Uncharacterized protein n=1 Tax=Rhodocollybia butyracea TaxID=206335 RepID=A0A9P5PX69_9AGAR|nr:hypothetical protein BDP27DRAFT_1446542 [Rhodocollybia butyracea]